MMHRLFAAATTATIVAFGSASAAEFKLTSPDLTPGAPITEAQYWNNFGCSGANERPALNWSDAPEGTKSFALTFFDQDAPTGSGFWHWVVYNIPAEVSGIAPDAIPPGAEEGTTDVGQPGYIGPCPPVGRQHTYTFTLHALNTEKIDAPAGATAALNGFFIYQSTIATATLSVTAGPRQ